MATHTPTVIEFDFENRRERAIPVEEARDACDNGLCCWIDVDVTQPQAAESVLHQFGVNPKAI